MYKNWGHDIVFQDGPTGVTWRWGNFDVSPQPDSLFELPKGADCSKTCSKFLGAEHHEALQAHTRMALLGETRLQEAHEAQRPESLMMA